MNNSIFSLLSSSQDKQSSAEQSDAMTNDQMDRYFKRRKHYEEVLIQRRRDGFYPNKPKIENKNSNSIEALLESS